MTQVIRPLPQKYFNNRIILVPRDPNTLYTYWEVDINWDHQPWLRINYLNEGKEQLLSEFEVQYYTNNYYIHVPYENCIYWVQLGYRDDTGSFINVLTSSMITTPAKSLAKQIDSKWPPLTGVLAKYQIPNYNLSSDFIYNV